MSYWARLRHWSQMRVALEPDGRVDAAFPADPPHSEPPRSDPPHFDPAAAPAPLAPPTRIDAGERIRAAFGPSQPVENREQLLGREQEIDQLFDVTVNLRSHAMVFGARGAGKTSLVRAFGDYADERGMLVVYLSCGAGGSFASIFRPYLDFLPPSCFPREEEAEIRRSIAALPDAFDARTLASILARIEGRDVIFIVDEFDRVDGDAIRGEIASFVKLLSDMRAPVLLVFVGIARNVHELIDGHASLRRHLVAVRIRRLSPAAVAEFFDQGEARSRLAFPADVRALIASLAGGSPYHLRLFAMHAAFGALRAGADTLSQPLVVAGLRVASANWASVNPETAAAIERQVRRGAIVRDGLTALGLIALEQDRFTVAELQARIDRDGGPDAAALLDALGGVLAIVDATGARQFDDPLAPQFLLLSCCLADEGEADAGHADGADAGAAGAAILQIREHAHVHGLR